MRIKRMLTMLLVLCMLVSALSPAVYAVSAGEDAHVHKEAADTSATDAQGPLNLRDNPLTREEAEETDEAEGTWTATPDASWSRSELSLLKVKSESVSDSVVSDSLQHCGL